jgi:hypothetical protein
MRRRSLAVSCARVLAYLLGPRRRQYIGRKVVRPHIAKYWLISDTVLMIRVVSPRAALAARGMQESHPSRELVYRSFELTVVSADTHE